MKEVEGLNVCVTLCVNVCVRQTLILGVKRQIFKKFAMEKLKKAPEKLKKL